VAAAERLETGAGFWHEPAVHIVHSAIVPLLLLLVPGCDRD
jgi:hypothetical protein